MLAARIASPAIAEAPARDSQAELEKAMSERCPHAAEAIRLQHQAADRRRGPPIEQVERPVLRRELLLRRDLDQAARGGIRFSSPALEMEYMKDVDGDNLRRLKHIIRQDGFPDRSHGRLRRSRCRLASGAARRQ